jgi:general stress protein YciG
MTIETLASVTKRLEIAQNNLTKELKKEGYVVDTNKSIQTGLIDLFNSTAPIYYESDVVAEWCSATTAYNDWEMNKPKKLRRGFSAMNPEKQREIASKGGFAAQAKGNAHKWTKEEAQAAGRKGGTAKKRKNSKWTLPAPLQKDPFYGKIHRSTSDFDEIIKNAENVIEQNEK